ncbi:MAG: hypothetical protein KKG75_02570 [Nanoarchaeota archaeon]|nr:hypothetical protein [Nanoarchaeota archaeon]
MYKKILFFLLFVVLISSVNASQESEWLIDQGREGVWSNMRETAFGVLALKGESGYQNEILNGSRYLIRQLESCMLTNTCNVKDTAIALWALNDVGSNSIIVNNAGTWLLNSRNMIVVDNLPTDVNKWYVQIISTVGGNCVLTNTETGNSAIVSVDTSQGYTPWFEVTSDLLTASTAELSLDCSSLGDNSLILSLINKKTVSGIENYFIKQEEHSKKEINVSFGIPCWGPSYRSGSCDTEITSYVLFVLDKIGKTGDPSWLKSQGNLGILENTFLYRLTANSQYLTWLATQKNTLGYWGSADLYRTSIVYSLLKPNVVVDGVENWIASRRHGDACWPKPTCSIEQTALVLYSGAYQVAGSGCPDLDGDGICDNNDNDIDGDGLLNDIDPYPRNPDANNNGVLDGDDDLDGDGFANKEDSDIDGDGVNNENDQDPWDETIGRSTDRTTTGGETVIVGGNCVTGEGCKGEYNAIGNCVDIAGDGCPSSDSRTSGTGASSGGSTGGTSPITPSKTSEDGWGVLTWILWIIALLIALVGGSYLAYKKGLLKLDFIKKGPKPEAKYTPRIGPIQKVGNYIPKMAKQIPKAAKYMENELDQSMKDLEKLLGKK